MREFGGGGVAAPSLGEQRAAVVDGREDAVRLCMRRERFRLWQRGTLEVVLRVGGLRVGDGL